MNSHFTIYMLRPSASAGSISWSGAALYVISMVFLTAAPPRGRRQNRLIERKTKQEKMVVKERDELKPGGERMGKLLGSLSSFHCPVDTESLVASMAVMK